MRFRVTARVRNDHLIAERERLEMSQPRFAEFAGVPVSAVRNLEKFRFDWISPESVLEHAQKIADAAGLLLHEVLPPDAVGQRYDRYFSGGRIVEVPFSRLLEAATQCRDRFLLPAPEDDSSFQQQAVDIREAVAKLPPREAHIITRRNGLDGQKAATLEEVGRELGVTRERVRTIESRATLRLQEDATFEGFRQEYGSQDDRI